MGVGISLTVSHAIDPPAEKRFLIFRFEESLANVFPMSWFPDASTLLALGVALGLGLG